MKVWLDAQLSPATATWMREALGVDAIALRDLGLRDASDAQIFEAARHAGAVVLTKDIDLVELLERHGPPPRIVWLRCGNTSNARLREILTALWPDAHRLLGLGEPLVEIGGP